MRKKKRKIIARTFNMGAFDSFIFVSIFLIYSVSLGFVLEVAKIPK